MGYEISDDKIKFIYKFTQGILKHSLSLNVAKMAKIP